MKSLSAGIALFSVLSLNLALFARAEEAGIFSNYSNLSGEDKASIDELVEICSDKSRTEVIQKPNGFSSVVFHSRPEGKGKGEPNVVDCAIVGIGPYKIKPSDIHQTKSCKVADLEKPFEAQKKALEELHYEAQMKRCEKTGTKILSGSCAKELGCNISRSLINMGTLGAASIVSQLSKTAKSDSSCLNFKQDDCMTSVVKKVFKAIWDLMVEVPKELIKGAAWVAKKTWNFVKSPWAKETEKQATQKMIIGSRTSDSQWHQFVSDPGGYIKETLTTVMKTIVEKAEKLGKDVKLGWKCATCNGLINGMCSLVGYLGGPIVLAAITGTIAGYAAKVFSSAADVKFIGSVFTKMGEAAHAFQKSKAMQAVKFFEKTAGKVVNVVAWPLNQTILALQKIPGIKNLMAKYVSAGEKAFMRGYLLKDAEAYAVWAEEKELQTLIANAEKGPLKRKMTEEEKAAVANHPTLFEGKLTQKEYESALRFAKHSSSDLGRTVNGLKKLSESKPQIAIQQARREAEQEIQNTLSMAKSAPKSAQGRILSEGNRRAKEILSAVESDQSVVKNEMKMIREIVHTSSEAAETFEALEGTLHKIHQINDVAHGEAPESSAGMQ
jgi:hypothetical protein